MIDHYTVIAEGLLAQPVAGSQAYVRLIQINRSIDEYDLTPE